MRTIGTWVTWLLLIAAPVAHARAAPPPSSPEATPDASRPAPTPLGDRVFFGGSVGASFGDVDYVSVAPTVGLRLTPKVAAGVSPFYVYRSYSSPTDVSTNDWGFDLYGRYRVVPPVFFQLQYSYTDYEYPLLFGGTERDTYSAVLGGGGYVQPIGGRASFVVSALYDFSYSNDEPAPYDRPWIVHAGVVVGF